MRHRAKSVTVVGLQWGDEGKGKVIDALAGEARLVARYQGGGNAGHTVVAGGKRYVFHVIPTGILYPEVTCVIGNGTVVDPVALKGEVDDLLAQGISLDGLKLSSRAHVVFPYHRALDEARELARSGKQKIGTTKRGIGPCYADKAARTGIRVADLFAPEQFSERLRRALDEKNAVLRHLFRRPPLEFQPIHEAYLAAAEALRPYVCDGSAVILEALARGDRVLFEGAQGIMLDLDHGTYPYVTSSNTGASGVASGAGVPPPAAGTILGISKAYTTRVGAGPFPTELDDDLGERLRTAGHEFGATTGRPRRCGWLDLVQLRYAIRVSGVDAIVLTKLDTLAGFGPIQVATAYRRDGEDLAAPPAQIASWEGIEPVLEERPGIPADADMSVRRYDELPAEARAYVEWVEEQLEVPVAAVSIGPEREAIIWRQPVFPE